MVRIECAHSSQRPSVRPQRQWERLYNVISRHIDNVLKNTDLTTVFGYVHDGAHCTTDDLLYCVNRTCWVETHITITTSGDCRRQFVPHMR